jgi:peptide/nickel transport system permease protein
LTELAARSEIAPVEPELTDAQQGLDVESVSPGRMALRRFFRHRLAVFSLAVFALIAITVILAPITAPHGEIDRLPEMGGKVEYVAPNAEALFGTDDLNRDLLSRIIWGGRVSLFVGIAVALVGGIIGTLVGAYAGFRGGLFDDFLMRVTDLFLAFPILVSLLVLRNMFSKMEWLAWLFGDLSSQRFMVVLLSLVGWMGVARIVRGVVLSLKEREFVEAERALGSSSRRIILRHLIPNAIGPILVAMTTSVVGAIVAESTLSFFGYGINPGEGKASWGLLLAASKGAVTTGRWWIALFPGIVFVITILCINFIGDGLRDAFDPKQGKVRA